jgi:uncharacterized membrane protein
MDIKNEFLVFLISAAPVGELRLAIPFGIAKGMGAGKVFLLALAGNTLPILPLLVFFRWVIGRLEHMRGAGYALRWWFRKVEKRSRIVQTFGFWGLVIFVGIPLPGSGIWSGAVAATLLEFKLKKGFWAVFTGMCIAGVLVSIISVFGWMVFQRSTAG